MIEAGWEDRAAKVLQKGFEIASRKGDILPRDAIAELLGRLGRPVPTVDVHAAGPASGAASFVCRRTGRPGSKLAAPPMRGAVGRWIQENISAETWRLWIAQGTKVINELRLDLSREEDQGIFDEHMYEFLGIDEEVLAGLGKT
jgi:Fe-S cluster biosynthesis and repair protein YggX